VASENQIGSDDYIFAFERIVLPIVKEFAPQFILVSAGFDAALGDPLGRLSVTSECYSYMT